MLSFDHFAVLARSLDEGSAWVADHLGVQLEPGGEHPLMGTHNRLLGLGPTAYLEVIAINPQAPAPGRPRWFDLDNFDAAPCIGNWVARSDDLNTDLARLPARTGTPMALSRGDLRWRMSVPDDGRLPFGGAAPALIEWTGPAHPAQRLPDTGITMTQLEIAHPQADALREVLRGSLNDPTVVFVQGPEKAMRASFDTPHGPRVLE